MTESTFGKIKQSWQKYLEQKKIVQDLVFTFYLGTYLLLWTNYILPYLKIADSMEPKIGLALIGFVLSSLLLIVGWLPVYSTSLTIWFINGVKKLV